MSKQLRILLKQNRLLEEKIFYETRSDEWRTLLITTQELSDALSSLSNQVVDNRTEQISFLKLLNSLDKLKGRPLPAFEKNALQVVEILFNALREYAKFDPKYLHILNGLQLAFSRLSLNDLSFLDNDKHVAVVFLEKLLELGNHFDQNAGKFAAIFIHAIELLIDRLANQTRITAETFVVASEKFDEYLNGFNEKVDANLAKILDEIERNSRQAQAEQYTEGLIKEKTNGEEMPIFLLDFYNNQLKGRLFDIIANHGVYSDECKQLLDDMALLLWSITYPVGDEVYKGRYQSEVVDMMRRMYQLFESSNTVNSYVKEFFFEAEDIHNKRLNGQRVSFDVMIACDIFADETYEDADFQDERPNWQSLPQASSNAFQPQQKQFDIATLKEGSWYFLSDENQAIRCRLLIICDLSQQIIFVNLSGEEVCRVAFSETDYLSHHLQSLPVNESTTYPKAYKALVRELAARLEVLKKEYQKLLLQKAKNEKERHAEEEKARLEVMRRIEETRRQQIRKRLEEHRLDMARKAEELKKEEAEAKIRFQLKGIFRKLVPGVVVAYQDFEHKWHELSLSLISNTTNKYIFTDARGDKILEASKDELLKLIEEHRLKILKTPKLKDDPLVSLVQKRRDLLG